MIIGLQITAIIFALTMIYFAILNFKRKEIEATELVSWVIIWIVTIFVVIFPNILRNFAQRFSVTRLFDLMVVAGFIVVISMSAFVYMKAKRLEKKLEEMVRKDSLKKIKSSKWNSQKFQLLFLHIILPNI